MATELEITDTAIKGLKPKEKVYTKHYGGGFYVYVLPNGRKVCRYCYDGKNITGEVFSTGKRKGKVKPYIARRFYLGDYVPGKGVLAKIKAKYEEAHINRIHNSIDPVLRDEKKNIEEAHELSKLKQEQLIEEGRMSLDDVAKAFLKKYKGLKGDREPSPRTMKDYRWHLENYILPKFGDFPMSEMPIDRVMDWLDDMAQSKPVMANRLFSTFSVLCSWARKQNRYQISQNPFAGRDKPGGREKAKKRVLDFNVKHKRFNDSGEISKVWNWLKGINPVHAAAFKMILLTGQRPGEVLSAEWEDIYPDEWVIPAEKTKNKKTIHKIPMVPKLQEIIEELREETGKSKYLFPAKLIKDGKDKPEKHIMPATLSRHIPKALKGEYVDGHGDVRPAGKLHGIERFSPHDLRRTCATHCGDLGFSMSDVGVLLNHVQGGVTAIYNQADGKAKKNAMLEAWHRRIDELVDGKKENNVVAMR